ncbi:MAG: hypothetical protein V7K25_11680 [Nostoc sp.]|uniref:hypothetical protein n=1 Tax=Nostoc sp. TaxID=1180 RepID=UPI002FFB46D5
MLDCCIAIAFWVNRKFYLPSQAFSLKSMILDSLLSVYLIRNGGSIEVALIFFIPRDDKSEASSRGASAIVGYEDF